MTDLLPATDAVLFANDDWTLRADGLEHRTTGYFIARETLGARRRDGSDLWEWPLQLAEKSWCAPRAFREAFTAALDRLGIARDDDLARSFAVGFGMKTGAGASVQSGFVSLGDLVRPKPAARKRPAPSDARSAATRRVLARGRLAVGADA